MMGAWRASPMSLLSYKELRPCASPPSVAGVRLEAKILRQ
jgi:hypothetical protein